MKRPNLALLLCLVFLGLGLASHAADPSASPVATLRAATNYLGQWMWDRETLDKQTCHFWKRFDIPKGARVEHAQLRIAADNAYTLFLDGRELGRGSDWRTVTVYDLTYLLSPGAHVLAVEGFNDNDKAGVIMGLHVSLADGQSVEVASDNTWRLVPINDSRWQTRRTAPDDWEPVTIVGALGVEPWWKYPTQFVNLPPFLPILVHFWQTGWFQIALLAACGIAGLTSFYLTMRLAVQSKAHRLLSLERVRIARDIHDDLGTRLTQLLLTGEEAQSKLPTESETRDQFGQMCDGARNVLGAIDEVVWVVNSQRDTLGDFVIYICKYAETFLRSALVRCRFDIQRELPDNSLDMPFRRNLLLTVKEALSNAVKHSGADEVAVSIRLKGNALIAIVEDNGRGFDETQVNPARHGLKNMMARMNDLGGHCRVQSSPGVGCRIEFEIPLPSTRLRPWRLFRRRSPVPQTADPSRKVREALLGASSINP
ncbi:MAG TPA: ATP-binding protein [Verrucomicrobiae bacterium]|jgi:two-component sensor histidine kinase|nr:ATP-binding protein [Verrucomicrobiae bacterium]